VAKKIGEGAVVGARDTHRTARAFEPSLRDQGCSESSRAHLV